MSPRDRRLPVPTTAIPSERSMTPEDCDRWLAAGIAVFHGSSDPADFPPLHDAAAQRLWLGGFGVAWAECPAGSDGWCAQPVDVALMLALEGREALLPQLCSRGLAPDVVH